MELRQNSNIKGDEFRLWSGQVCHYSRTMGDGNKEGMFLCVIYACPVVEGRFWPASKMAPDWQIWVSLMASSVLLHESCHCNISTAPRFQMTSWVLPSFSNTIRGRSYDFDHHSQPMRLAEQSWSNLLRWSTPHFQWGNYVPPRKHVQDFSLGNM